MPGLSSYRFTRKGVENLLRNASVRDKAFGLVWFRCTDRIWKRIEQFKQAGLGTVGTSYRSKIITWLAARNKKPGRSRVLVTSVTGI